MTKSQKFENVHFPSITLCSKLHCTDVALQPLHQLRFDCSRSLDDLQRKEPDEIMHESNWVKDLGHILMMMMVRSRGFIQCIIFIDSLCCRLSSDRAQSVRAAEAAGARRRCNAIWATVWWRVDANMQKWIISSVCDWYLLKNLIYIMYNIYNLFTSD